MWRGGGSRKGRGGARAGVGPRTQMDEGPGLALPARGSRVAGCAPAREPAPRSPSLQAREALRGEAPPPPAGPAPPARSQCAPVVVARPAPSNGRCACWAAACASRTLQGRAGAARRCGAGEWLAGGRAATRTAGDTAAAPHQHQPRVAAAFSPPR